MDLEREARKASGPAKPFPQAPLWKAMDGGQGKRERLPGSKHLAARHSQAREQLPALGRTASLLPGCLIPAPLATSTMAARANGLSSHLLFTHQ